MAMCKFYKSVTYVMAIIITLTDIPTTFTGGLQQDLQLFKFTSFFSYTGLQPLLAACSKTSNSSPSPASPGGHLQGPFLFLWSSFSRVRYPHFLHWRPAAGPPTLQLHQLLQSLHSKTLAGLPPLGFVRYRVLLNLNLSYLGS